MSVREVETRVVDGVQAALARGPLPAVARGLSTWGEHGAGWYALAGVGALVDRRRRRAWVHVGVSAFTAHAAAVVIKRVVRRRRPDPTVVTALVRTPSELSFPSAHATSTTAAAVALAPLLGAPLTAGTVAAMAGSRVLLGVHFVTDVLGGALVGAAVERTMRVVTGVRR